MFIDIMLTLVLLTRPDGSPVAIVPDQIVYIMPEVPSYWHDGCVTRVQTYSGPMCVRESFEEVIKKLSMPGNKN